MKIELTISENYCIGWGLYEGSREFVQNGRDAMKSGCAFDGEYFPAKKCIRLTTKGATLTRDTLLLGVSSKRNDPDTLGQYGEGYKIGSLALLRIGKTVSIRTGDETWEPRIAWSKKFNSNVIVFNITGGRTFKNEIIVEIGNVEEEEWNEIRGKFLFFHDGGTKAYHADQGAVLIDRSGEMFVDGIYVCQDANFKHGYDFKPSVARLDRDRRLMNSWDSQSLAAKIWEKLYLSDKMVNEVDEMLASNRRDVEHFKHDWVIGEATRKKVAAQFVAKHGSDAIPVADFNEMKEVEFHGKRGELVTAEPLRLILQKEVGSAASIALANKENVKDLVNKMSLTDLESSTLVAAVNLVEKATGVSVPPLYVVNFTTDGTVGMRKNGEIFISRKVLLSFKETLKTVVEEVAHEHGADGTHAHAEAMHEIYANIVADFVSSPITAAVAPDSAPFESPRLDPFDIPF